MQNGLKKTLKLKEVIGYTSLAYLSKRATFKRNGNGGLVAFDPENANEFAIIPKEDIEIFRDWLDDAFPR